MKPTTRFDEWGKHHAPNHSLKSILIVSIAMMAFIFLFLIALGGI